MKSTLRVISILAVAASLTGCAGYIRTMTKVQNLGLPMNPKSVNAHVYAEVSRDEEWVRDIFINRRAQYFPSGVLDDNGTQNYRIAEMFMTLLDDAMIFPPTLAGTHFIFRVGAVPDQFPRLYKGDIVELRNVGTWDTMIDFPVTGEGNAITRVLCRVKEPTFKDCRNSLPRVGLSGRPSGLTDAPFRPSMRDYAPLTYTVWYDNKGKPNREYPASMPPGFETFVASGPVKNPGLSLADRIGLRD